MHVRKNDVLCILELKSSLGLAGGAFFWRSTTSADAVGRRRSRPPPTFPDVPDLQTENDPEVDDVGRRRRRRRPDLQKPSGTDLRVKLWGKFFGKKNFFSDHVFF